MCVSGGGEQERDFRVQLAGITVMLMLIAHNAPSESVMIRNERNL